jgi:crotonobetainyl-CoA:carnitine CoA-transferase CaiB-like acyl-CoA transferase
MPGALDGIFVVTMEQAVAAPLASARLADAGARVVKLEREDGDFARGYDDFVQGQSTYFVWVNRGKESCRVDLKDEADRALVEAMVARADVFIQNFAPGAAARLGLGGAELRKRHRRLIVCEISGYAAGSPDHDRKAYDLLLQAEVGLSAITGAEGSDPARVGVSLCDIATGEAAYAAILEALIRRGRTGEGSLIELSLFDTLADHMNVPYLTRRYGGFEPKRLGLAHPSICPYGVFKLADGEIVISIQNEREWLILCTEALGDPDLADDPRFSSNVLRVKNRQACDARVQKALENRSRAEVTATLDTARIAYGLVSSVADLMAHRSATALPVETPGGPAEVLAPPVVIDGRRRTLGPVPALGQHDATLRAEFAPLRAAGE